MEPTDEKKKINEDLVVFMRKRSDTEAPRYTARLKTYVDFQQKRRRADAARDHHYHDRKPSSPTNAKKKVEPDQKDKNAENRANTPNGSTKRKSNCGMSGEHPGSEDGRMSRRRGGGGEDKIRGRSFSRTRSEPSDRCRRRRRRRCGRRRRRRSCRRRRRRRSCRRRRRCRRRRSCRRRRRRSSCSRRRRRRRRRRC